MSFEINDPRGQPLERGTAEEWWTEHGGSRVLLSAPSFGTAEGTDSSALHDDAARRSLDLASELLDATHDPTGTLGNRNKPGAVQKKKFGLAELACALPGFTNSGLSADWPMYCFTENLRAIRLVRGGTGHALARNSLVKFQGSIVAKEVDIQYLDKMAIAGHVDVLESYHPEAAAIGATPAKAVATDYSAPYVGPAFVAGTRLGGKNPLYPSAARQSGVSGTVILGAEISKQGTIAFVFPIASSSSLLTGSAIDAVKTWRYTPYLVNGQVATVSSTITVNYNLSAPAYY